MVPVTFCPRAAVQQRELPLGARCTVRARQFHLKATRPSYNAAHRNKATEAEVSTINREVGWPKQMFTLAVESGKLTTKPTIKLPKENKVAFARRRRPHVEARVPWPNPS
jgi:hypothetical protein